MSTGAVACNRTPLHHRTPSLAAGRRYITGRRRLQPDAAISPDAVACNRTPLHHRTPSLATGRRTAPSLAVQRSYIE
jgi:hypothetical protein